MKLALLSSRFPYPIEKGDKLRLYHQMKDLAKHHEIHLISLYDEEIKEESIAKVTEICSSIHLFRLSEISSISSAALGLFNSKPFQVNYFYSRKINREIGLVLDEIAPDAIYCQLLRMSEYVIDSAMPKILDYMDCFSMNYAKRQKFERFPLNLFFKNEARRLNLYEQKMIQEFDALTIISERDAKQISDGNEIQVICNGIDCDFFTPRSEEKDCDLLFVGNMGYHPNVLAAKYLVEKIAPQLDPSITIKIAGARPTKAIQALAKGNTSVTGWIEDIRKAYASCHIFVAPIFSGAGQQNKILEAMSMGLICITTKNVNEAIGAKNGEHLFIADNEEEFALIIKNLLKNKEHYVQVSQKAREFVNLNFSWSKENKKLNDIIIKQVKRNK